MTKEESKELKENSTNFGNYYNKLYNITNIESKYYFSHGSGSKWISGAYGTKISNSFILLSTGASDDFCKQGIYDLAGNVWEWTLEYTSISSAPCVKRGGYYGTYGNGEPIAKRNFGQTSYKTIGGGFRVSLF